VRLTNRSSAVLRALDVKLNSLDVYSIDVVTEGSFIPVLDPGGQELIPVQVSASLPGSVYITVEGERAEEPFHWESPDMTVKVGDASAELVSLVAAAEPGGVDGEWIRCEASVRGHVASEGLTLQIWAETPAGGFKELASVETKPLSPGEESRYVVEAEAGEEGTYEIYACLYDGTRRLGRETERVRTRQE